MTRPPRARVGAAIGALALAVALGACSSGSSDASSTTSSSRSNGTTTSTAVTPLEQWVAQWRGIVATDYGPAQQELLSAVQGGVVAEVQGAVTKVLAANQKLLAAISAAGPPPADGHAAAGKLQLALVAEQKLVHEIQRVCTSSNAECQPAVNQYGDNNSKQVVPALVALKI